ncbi:MAG: dihydrolipoyl dehydrogenase, partial [Gammaproteobacteria bacterium]
LKVNDITVKADNIVIATGSTPIVPEPWKAFGDRIMTTDDFFEQETLPESVAVIGLGVIGLELGQAMARLGVKVTGVDMTDILSGLSDPDINQQAREIIGKEFELWQGAPAELEEADGKIRVRAGDKEVIVDKVLAAMGRRPNLDRLKLENLGAPLDQYGVPEYDHATQRIGDTSVFIVGDADNEKPILHEAADDGKIAAFNILAGESTPFRRKTPLAITFTDPNIIQVGQCWNNLDQGNIIVGQIPMGPVGRALTKAKNRGLLKVYVEKNSGKLLGGAMIGVCGENIAHLLAWSVQQEKTVVDLLRMPFYHPVMEEALQGALRNALGQLEIDLPKYVEVEPLR